MSTLSESRTSLSFPADERTLSVGWRGRGIGLWLLRILVGLLTVLLLLPVVVLPFMTTVPLVLVALLLLVDAGLVFVLLSRNLSLASKSAAVAGIFVVSLLSVVFSQWFASTPPIVDVDGSPLPNSIAVMEVVDLNGSKQWITIRGHDVNRPVLLFLAGGPGGSELAWTRSYWRELEQDFVIVNWDQPGAGKSYRAVDFAELTTERYVSDAHALTQMLRERFQEEKIYLVGESWGSILGIRLIQQYPELFHAYVGSGQMVNTNMNDELGFKLAVQYAFERGDLDTFAGIMSNGAPPYTEGNIALKYNRYLMVLNQYMSEQAKGDGSSFNQIADVLAPGEYGLVDKINWFIGLMNTFNTVYPQLTELDFTKQAAELQVPVYFTIGRHDVNALASLVEQYYDVLQAPHKELIWFERSGHTPLWEERGKFIDVMVNTVLAQTYP